MTIIQKKNIHLNIYKINIDTKMATKVFVILCCWCFDISATYRFIYSCLLVTLYLFQISRHEDRVILTSGSPFAMVCVLEIGIFPTAF